MPVLQVEKIGGLAGFGGSHARIRSRGQIDTSTMPAAQQRAVEALFQGSHAADTRKVADGFRYKITRTIAAKVEMIEVSEAAMPAVMAACVKDEFV